MKVFPPLNPAVARHSGSLHCGPETAPAHGARESFSRFQNRQNNPKISHPSQPDPQLILIPPRHAKSCNPEPAQSSQHSLKNAPSKSVSPLRAPLSHQERRCLSDPPMLATAPAPHANISPLPLQASTWDQPTTHQPAALTPLLSQSAPWCGAFVCTANTNLPAWFYPPRFQSRREARALTFPVLQYCPKSLRVDLPAPANIAAALPANEAEYRPDRQWPPCDNAR